MVEINNTTKEDIDIDLVQEVAEKFLKEYKKEDMDVSIAFVGSDEIRKLNKQYRNKDSVTDVLSFEGDTSAGFTPKDGQAVQGDNSLGEVIICFDQIKKQAKELGNGEKDELVFILIHGLLHLIGYDDETEEEREEMVKKGEEFIKKFNF